MKFTKMQGAGNDFIVINNMEEKLPQAQFAALARRLCTRRMSIGADGMMIVDAPQNGGDYRMYFYNADGSLGEMCGNGARCIARYGYEKGLAGETQRVETTAGLVVGQRRDKRMYTVRLNDITKFAQDVTAKIDGKAVQCDYLELGDPGLPHAVVLLDGDCAMTQEALRELGYYGGTRDGVFGDATRVAVMAFQTANGLAPTGEADRAMLLLLHEGQTLPWEDFIAGKVCKRGDSGVGVRSLQRRLKRMGYYNGECTDAFGESTQRAVERFQEQNGLEATGAADEETCRLLYSGSGVSLTDDGVLRQGDAGESVAELQQLLHALGYLPAENDGSFGADTYVAVVLYQIASGLTPTGEADAALVESLRAPEATPLSQAEEALRASVAAMDAATLSWAGAVAAELPGQAFDGGANANYPGFPFAQYVYARVGVGLTGPGRILEEAVHQPFDAAGATGGEIVILQNPDGSLLYAVSLGGARIAYADAATGFVVSGDLSSMGQVNAYVWKPSAL